VYKDKHAESFESILQLYPFFPCQKTHMGERQSEIRSGPGTRSEPDKYNLYNNLNLKFIDFSIITDTI